MKKDCDNCAYSGRPSYKYPCYVCGSQATRWELKSEPKTNADRIRAMSDEELAEFLCSVYDDDDKLEKHIEGYVIPCWDEDRIKEWLQQPVED